MRPRADEGETTEGKRMFYIIAATLDPVMAMSARNERGGDGGGEVWFGTGSAADGVGFSRPVRN